ncbi:MAG: hypothetical protein MZV63_41545, partial [Marinilabiliales bacterium]|nr:hypothetical protein [Marinilabiliales bacterium]
NMDKLRIAKVNLVAGTQDSAPFMSWPKKRSIWQNILLMNRLIKLKKEKEISQPKKVFQESPKKAVNQGLEEVDLHIQVLVDGYQNLIEFRNR